MKVVGFFLITASLLSLFLPTGKTESRMSGREFKSSSDSMSASRPTQSSTKIKLKKKQTYEGYHKAFFSPDGSMLALMTTPRTDVIEVSTNRLIHRINPPNASFFSVIFSPDSKLLVTSYLTESSTNSLDKVTVWDTSTWREIRTLIADPPAYSSADNLSFSEDGRYIASHTGGVARLLEVETGRKVREFLPPSDLPGYTPFASLVSPDGKWVAVYFGHPTFPLRRRVVYVYEIETGQEAVLETTIYRDWRFSRDSTMLAISALTDVGRISERAVAETWDTGNWTRKRVIEAPSGWQAVFTVDLSPDGQMIAIGGRRKFGIFSIETGELLVEKQHPTGSFDSELYYDLSWVEFSPDGKSLLTGGWDGTVKRWKIKNKSTQQ